MPRRKLPLLAWLALLLPIAGLAQIDTVQTITPDVVFHQGDPRRGHSNNGWIVLDDYVLVIEANFPSGAKVVMPKIAAMTSKPVRFVVDTHQHGDHAYGNQLWADAGATIVAHSGAYEALKNAGAADWAAAAKGRPDVAATTLKLPSVIFPDTLVFADDHHRVELHWFGVAHTRGDTFLWLPKEKILFTGDACVNGPHNFVANGDTGEWIKTLEQVKKLGAVTVCPGHGPIGGPEVIADQQSYFIELRRVVQALIDAKKTPEEVKAAVPALAAELKANPHIARYVQANPLGHVEKVYAELTGSPLSK